jgi:hypothetical protein
MRGSGARWRTYGRRFVAELRAAGLDVDYCEELLDVRRTLVVHADGGVTSFWEPGHAPVDPARAARRCCTRCGPGSRQRGRSP